MNELENFFSDINNKLELDNDIREKLISLGRKSVRNSSISIRYLHRNEIEKAEELIQENKEVIMQINELAKQMNNYPFGMILSCNQEYVESVFLYSFIRGNKFPNYVDLNIPYLPYLHGICDFIGELRRVILDSLRKKEGVDLAVTALELMDDLYSLLIMLDYPDGLTYNLRKKIDIIRNLTEKTRGDVTLALNRIDLINTIDNILKSRLKEINL